MKKSLKLINIAIILFFLYTLIYITVSPKSSVTAASNGIKLWLEIIFPSLFPAITVFEILQKSNFIEKSGKFFEPIMRPLFDLPGCSSYGLILGLFSGFPIGAKVSKDLRLNNLLSKNEAERLLIISNNSSPAFIICTIGYSILNLPIAGFIIFFSNITSALLLGMILKITWKNKELSNFTKTNYKNLSYLKNSKIKNSVKYYHNFGEILFSSLTNSIKTILIIGGYVIFFSVLIDVIIYSNFIGILTSPMKFLFINFGGIEYFLSFQSAICGLIEMTNGIFLISQYNIPLNLKILTASFLIGWGGISVHAQTEGIILESDISMKPYFIGKMVHALLNIIITYILLNII